MDLEDGSYFKPWQLWPWRGITIRIIDTHVLDVQPPPKASTQRQARFSGWRR